MKVTLANHYPQPAINLLDGMKLAGAASRERTRLIPPTRPAFRSLAGSRVPTRGRKRHLRRER